MVWRLDIPPRIKLFGWRLCKDILPTGFNIAKRISSFNMTCSICNHPEETDVHALLECPMAVHILEGSTVDNRVWTPPFRSMEDCFVNAMRLLDDDHLGIFATILSEVWNARNRFLFGYSNKSLSTLSQIVISFVHNYRAAQDRDHVPGPSMPPFWTPPPVGFYKLNFDGGRLGESSWGHGFVIRAHLGCACLLGLQYAKEAGIANLIVEGDCLTLINLLKFSKVQDTFIGFLVRDILSLATSFSFCSWSFLTRAGNKVAHDLAHLQPYSFNRRVWDVDAPNSILDRAYMDMYEFTNSNIS